ncbi:MAG TPA: LysR substrate-binding domain-containing protein [Pyrinomonadaceae bacterium]|nr:LysR substrate-binding domain-containing protein [Pyrinomonadaceae bacterium]
MNYKDWSAGSCESVPARRLACILFRELSLTSNVATPRSKCTSPLAGRRVVKPQELSKELFIFREQGSATRAVVAAHLRKSGIEAEAVMEMANPESVKKAVQNGLGIAFYFRVRGGE